MKEAAKTGERGALGETLTRLPVAPGLFYEAVSDMWSEDLPIAYVETKSFRTLAAVQGSPWGICLGNSLQSGFCAVSCRLVTCLILLLLAPVNFCYARAALHVQTTLLLHHAAISPPRPVMDVLSRLSTSESHLVLILGIQIVGVFPIITWGNPRKHTMPLSYGQTKRTSAAERSHPLRGKTPPESGWRQAAV